MAEILLNNKKDAENFILFDSVPNIVTIKSTTTSQTKAQYEFNFSTTNLSDIVENAVIEVNGFQVQATNDLSSAMGRKFYIPSSNESLAVNVMMALQNIPNLAMLYNFYHINDTDNFKMIAKDYGSQYNIALKFNPLLTETDATNIEPTYVNSSITNELYGENSSKIYIDIYSSHSSLQSEFLQEELTPSIPDLPYEPETPLVPETSTQALGDEIIVPINPYFPTIPTNFVDLKYTVTLEKEFYDKNTNFNISPILTTLSNNDSLTIFRIIAYCIKDGNYVYIGKSDVNYSTKGYLVNQGNRYIDFDGEGFITYMPALNVQKGTNKNTYNKSTLYVYDPLIKLTMYYASGSIGYTIKYLASDESVIETRTSRKIPISQRRSYLNVKNLTIDLDEDTLRQSFYVDIQFDFGTLRYNVINPPYGNIDCTRVYWYNSYGGISFFDFTGDKQEERKASSTTYDKSLLDYYTSTDEEQRIVYIKDTELTTKLTTHLMDKNGLYQLYDLQNSYTVWIVINNKKYYIIVSEVSVEEPSDNIYKATIKYTYSLMDSFN